MITVTKVNPQSVFYITLKNIVIINAEVNWKEIKSCYTLNCVIKNKFVKPVNLNKNMSCSLDLFGSLWLVPLIKEKNYKTVCYIFIHEKVYLKVFFTP